MSNSLSLQQKLEIEDIKEGVVVLKGNILRAVLAVSSVNFALKSLDEQKALIARYQEFLNSLDFPIEVLVTSRKYDLSEYAEMLRAQAKQQKNELLKIQTNEYVDFIKNLAEMTNIMSKNFYVVVPFAAGEKAAKNISEKIFGFFKPPSNQTAQAQQSFREMKSQLWQRVEYVIMGLGSMGLRSAPMNTEELIELFYKFYNPEATEEVRFEQPGV